MTTTTLDLKVTADAKSAVTGFKTLQTSLENVTKDANKAESAMKDLDKSHKISLNDQAIDTARKEIQNLRQQMAKDLSIDATADVRTAQTRIRQLQAAVRTLDAETVDVKAVVNVDDSDLASLENNLGDTESSGFAAAGAIGGITGALGGLSRSIPIIGSVVTGVGGIAYAGGKAIGGMVGLADKMDNAKIAFEQFLGSAPKADAFLNDLQDFSAKTPFEFPELVDAGKKLLAFGTDADDVIGIMTTLGDAAALTGADVGDLTTIWGQMSAKGKVSNEELLQLTESGVPAYDALAKSMGKTVPEIQKMAEEGKLLSDTTLPKLKKGLDATFGGGMAKQAETLSGKWSTLKDTIGATATDLGEALLPFVSSIVDSALPALDDLAAWVEGHKADIVTMIAEGSAGFIDFGAAVLDWEGTLAGAFGSAIEWIGNLVTNIGQAGQALSGLPGMPDDLGDGAVAAGEKIVDLGRDVQGTQGQLHSWADDMRAQADNLRDFGKDIAEGFKTDAARQEISKLQTSIADLKKKPPSPEIDARIKAAQDKLKTLRNDLKATAQTDRVVSLNIRIDKAKNKIKDIKESIAYLSRQKATPEVTAEIKQWRAKLKELRADLADMKKKRATIPIDAVANTKAAGAEVDGLANKHRTATIGVTAPKAGDVDKKLDGVAKPRTATMGVTAPKAGEVSKKLDGVAKTRTANINVNANESAADRAIDNAARDRTANIHVTYTGVDQTPRGFGSGQLSVEAQSQSIVPQLFPSTDTATVAGLRTAARSAPEMVAASTPYGIAAPAPVVQRGTVTQLAPRQVPVKVYLDGAEIADHLTLKAGRLATVSPVRRRA